MPQAKPRCCKTDKRETGRVVKLSVLQLSVNVKGASCTKTERDGVASAMAHFAGAFFMYALLSRVAVFLFEHFFQCLSCKMNPCLDRSYGDVHNLGNLAVLVPRSIHLKRGAKMRG